MRRREFITVLGSAAAVWPLTAQAQQRKIPTIGVLVVGSPGSEQFWWQFRYVMRELGYVEGQSVRYEYRSDQGQVSRLPELAAELVRLNVAHDDSQIGLGETPVDPHRRAAPSLAEEYKLLAIVGIVVKKQLQATRQSVSAVAPSASAANVAEQSRQIQQQIKADVTKALEQGAAAAQRQEDSK